MQKGIAELNPCSGETFSLRRQIEKVRSFKSDPCIFHTIMEHLLCTRLSPENWAPMVKQFCSWIHCLHRAYREVLKFTRLPEKLLSLVIKKNIILVGFKNHYDILPLNFIFSKSTSPVIDLCTLGLRHWVFLRTCHHRTWEHGPSWLEALPHIFFFPGTQRL